MAVGRHVPGVTPPQAGDVTSVELLPKPVQVYGQAFLGGHTDYNRSDCRPQGHRVHCGYSLYAFTFVLEGDDLVLLNPRRETIALAASGHDQPELRAELGLGSQQQRPSGSQN